MCRIFIVILVGVFVFSSLFLALLLTMSSPEAYKELAKTVKELAGGKQRARYDCQRARRRQTMSSRRLSKSSPEVDNELAKTVKELTGG